MIGSRLTAAVLAVVGLAVAWRVTTFGLAGYFAGDDARLALRFDPKQPDALVRLAGERLAEDKAADAEALAKRALQARPLNSAAFRALGFAASDQNDRPRADAMMAAAAGLSRRDLPANAWVFNKALGEHDYPRAFRQADALLRREPDYADQLYSQLIAALDEPAAVEALNRRLAQAPVWRGSFLAVLAGQGSETAIRAVLRRVQTSPQPLSDQEMAWVLRRYFIRHSRREVRDFWVSLLDPADRARVSYLYDGGFETGTGLQPFAWQETRAASAATTFTEMPGANGKALHAEHYGSRKARILSQLLLLEPGRWRLSGRVNADSDAELEPLVWTVACGSGTPLASARLPGGRDWRAFSTSFSVPAGCDTQVLALESRPQDSAGASAWFDDLTIEPDSGGRP